ncbi:MAG: hypothetical protein A3F84_02690 [Candidatus Handelsmanbacteria bacterium RIFCSPLOWO2_12_FULL_64_10]|uniref:FAD-dependent oxidoreductase n=1 Tax=Handelsmanbacteria sp. (strain RIFCSPLOWO2_12_FULL_64_10) TaxID=1817868 RepID=A0A1F6CWQ0_HANXR|nr:MAG: hypothetical protein A3F84_02690 [Candidatus Handelsmanbacteria bacterium RIFCSPLOWO2_12_FULL_64_10]
MATKTIREPAREVPVMAEADVLVVGGGTAGLPAAVAAARAGADVLLVERYGYVGGASSGGLVITLPEDRQGAYTRELEERLVACGGGRRMPEHRDWLVWCPEMLKWMGLRMLEEAGVRMLFHAMAVGAVVEDGAVQGIVVEGKGGRGAVLGKVVVDCTGDADIAALAGARFAKGDGDGRMLDVTMMFLMLGVDEARYLSEKPKTDLPRRMGGVFTRLRPGELNVWGGAMPGIDGTDPWDLTRCENELRKQVVEWVEWARASRPGCESAHLALTSPQLGVRETRRIVGDHVMTKEEWKAGVEFPDHIGYAYEGKSVPYRSLIPQGVENLLVAGRCISTDHETQGPMRIIPPCMVTGHAAGEAAAQAVNDGATPRGLDVGRLQARLRGLGVPFPHSMEEVQR